MPQAQVAAAHGQMSEAELERVVGGFIDGEYDVLVCTTIIESGIDIPSVNTIIVYMRRTSSACRSSTSSKGAWGVRTKIRMHTLPTSATAV